VKITRPQLQKIVKEVLSRRTATPTIQEKNLDQFPIKLSQWASNADKAKQVAAAGLNDGDSDDDKINVTPNATFPVSKLKPSQSSMNIDKALGMVLSMLGGKMGIGGDLGAFISKDLHIMDGHHRWVATAMVDPSKEVGGYSVDFPGAELIKILNAITVGKLGINSGKKATGNFEQFQEPSIRAKLKELTTQGSKHVRAEEAMAIIEKWTGQQGEAALQVAGDKMVANLKSVSFDLPAGAPSRPDMPVIDDEWAGFPKDSGKAAKIANAALARGEVDWNDPSSSGNKESAKRNGK